MIPKRSQNIISSYDSSMQLSPIKNSILFICLCLLAFQINAQSTQTFSASGTWTCPAGVTSATVQGWGGGGSGGGATGNPAAGGGGSGGAYTSATLTVVPGTVYTVTVGSGGTGSTGAGASGGSSWFSSSTTLLAVGGSGGALASTNSFTAAGASAVTTGNVGGTTNFYGGAGGTGAASGVSGGGGGGSAGTASNGNAASGVTGGVAVTGGGAGANGSTTSAAGAACTSVGGGGAGGRAGNNTDRDGGDGGTGQVLITFTCPAYNLSSTSGTSPVYTGSTSTITLTSTAAGLPAGTYTVTYNLSAPNAATGQTAAMTVSTAGSGTFSTGTLSNAGATTVTVTNISSGSCSSAISSNNTSVVTVNTAPTGCTSNTSLYPSSTYTPSCIGVPETITTGGWATEYSQVNVVSGTTYTFASSISTDFLTIANGSGGAPIYASGTTPVVWTATLTGVIRFYNNTNSACGTNTTSRTRTVQCGTPATPPANDECSAAVMLTSNATCVSTAGTILAATASSQSNGCSGTADDDVWYSFVATTTTHYISITNVTGSTTDLYHSVYSGSCASPGTAIVCSDPNTSTLTGLTVGTTYYIRVFTYTSTTGQTTSFDICVTGCTSAPANDECSGAIALTMNSYNSCTSTSAGNVTCATGSGTSTGSCSGNPDDDIWYSFVATGTSHQITLTTSSGFDAYMQLYSGTCGALTSIQCSDPNSFNATGLTIGNTYYIRVYSYASGAPINGSITMCVSAPPSCPTNMGSGNVNIASLPYSGTGQTTCGAGNDLTSSNTVTCGSSSYLADEDKIYVFTPSSSGNITVTLNSTQSWTGATLYEGCPFTGTCVAYVQTSSSGSKNFCTSVVAGTTYYLLIDGWGTSGSCITTFTLNITAPSAGPANELPCGATALTLGTSVTDNNTCTGSSGEPSIPSCWTTGSANTLWYSFVAPSGGNVYIQTTIGTISSTQIALYSGTCGSSMTLVSCNQYPAVGCSGTTSTGSTISATGLTPGTTYYVRVDGRNDYMGTYTIVVSAGTSAAGAPVPGQDCLSPLVLCSASMSIGNPGYSNTGNICDFTGTGNCTSGELNSVWYQINIGATGNFNFTLMPNDGSNSSCGSETDYDYLLWKVSGAGATTSCATISSSSGTALLACNFDSYGVTGIAAGGNAPSPINSCFNAAFESTVSVTAGDVLYLVIQNYSGSTQGFTVDFSASGAGVINYTAPSTVYWTGGASTVWQNATNWGSCATYPVCGVNAVVTAASAIQPSITGTEYVKDLTINPGSTLTLGPSAVLHICGSFTNNGTFTADPASTVIFENSTGVQYISGSFTGGNKFGNLTITKTAGSVFLNNDIDVGGNFTTSNSTSVFNSNGLYVRVAKNFSNSAGNSTYTNTGATGTLEFNGTSTQTYNQGSSQLDLNSVLMNHTGTGVTLLTDMNIKSVSGTLTLTAGKIITTGSYKVIVANSTTTSVSTGNTSSYVYGYLRRYINNSTGSFDFPVGTSTAYQRANVNFTIAPVITYLTADFQTYSSVPGPLGSSECGTTYNMNALDNGFWNIDANTANNNTGAYTMTLYNTAYTNASAGWTVMARHNGSATWDILNGDGSSGTCVASPVTAVSRQDMKGFSKFGSAQSSTPLPIELVSFSGKNEGIKNKLEWITSSELNNDYFSLEHSDDGSVFESFQTVDGAGNSSVRINYNAYDYAPYNGTTYYRLKQTDFNGNYSYSSVISVENKMDQIAVTNVHPNPTSSDLSFDFYAPVNGTVKIQILDYTGRVVVNKKQSTETGKSVLNTEMGTLAKGVYSLVVEFSEGHYKSVTKVIKY
jgi:hypothetical protein